MPAVAFEQVDIVFGANAQLVGLENSAVQLAGRNIEVTNNGDVLTYRSGRQVAAIAVGMPADATMETDTVVENIVSAISKLYRLGARQFLVPNRTRRDSRATKPR